MPTTDPIEILIQHDAWATRQILLTCTQLSPSRFAWPFEIGPGSLQATLTHIIGAMQTWNDTLAVRPLGERIDVGGRCCSPAELLPMLDEVAGEFQLLARAHPLEGIVKRTRGDTVYTYTRAGVITHVVTHGMHHRAQCLNMLRHVGVKPLPPSSIAEWCRMVDTAA